MISRLSGIIKFKGEKFIVMDIGGVGYRISVSKDTLARCPKLEKNFSLWTHLHVREDILELYGFMEYPELQFFEQLIQISGIGPKSGLAVLSVAPIDVLKRAIASGETSYLIKVSGIGNKLANKIVLELRDKMAALGNNSETGAFQEEGEALDALESLGYSVRESREAVKKVSKDISGTGNIIKEALRNINRK